MSNYFICNQIIILDSKTLVDKRTPKRKNFNQLLEEINGSLNKNKKKESQIKSKVRTYLIFINKNIFFY